ncbi:MAG: hypothetical protein HY048_01865 [Acidobacteria bacterium]|nr:hypothetical protein [Acidobacteriota bacterium]
MRFIVPKRLVQLAPAFLAALVFLSDARPARADITCFQDLRGCYVRAASADSWFGMWLMGMDCELAFTDCTRRAIVGR